MIIRNNTNGKRAQRYYGATTTELNKTLEKLSSGYRINRAGDDAAGLAISEKMRAQIAGLGRAQKNSQEGINLIQIGEGSLQEVQDMLNRAIEMAGESANGTYTDQLDRENLEKELDHIRSEIDRITKSANFNGVKLFQDKGLAYERSIFSSDVASAKLQQELANLERRQQLVSQKLKSAGTRQQAQRAVSNAQQDVGDMQELMGERLKASETRQTQDALSDSSREQPAETREGEMTLDELSSNTKPDEVNIVYIENESVATNQTASGTTGSYMVTENGQQKSLNEILEQEIVPNIVKNILENYPAFSYLEGSSIGIGLEYFHGNGTDKASTLAYVRMRPDYSSATGFSLAYTLGVNLDQIGTWNSSSREELEATIAHEMIHAFMDEAATSGMLGLPADSTGTIPGTQTASEEFPLWFIEGMAQTASGHGGWVSENSGSGLRLTASSTDAEIKSQIQDANKRLGSDTTGSRYSTGYLACMYLGWAIAGKGQPSIGATTVDASTISYGLNKLLQEVVKGSSLNDAIKKLTGGTFSSIADFEKKFNAVDDASAPGLCDFTRGLLGAIGTGRGGLITGDLAARDLASDDKLTGVNLFKLDPEHDTVKNVYPTDYPVLTGGTLGTSGVAPKDYIQTVDFEDFSVSGIDLDSVKIDDAGNLVISGDDDFTITMKNGVTSTNRSIILQGAGKVTLNGVHTSGTIQVAEDAQAVLIGNNTVGDISAAKDGSVTLSGAAVIGGTLPSSVSTSLKETSIPWNDIGLSDLASITIDGVKFDASILTDAQNAKLWLDPSLNHKIIFTDSNNNSKTLVAERVYGTDGVTVTGFTWAAPPRPYTVTGGTEGVDWKYDDDGETLIILSDKSLTISKGDSKDENGNDLIGRIKVADNISGTVDLTLDGISSNVSTGCAFDLGTGNTVKLHLADGTTSAFTSGAGYAGIHVGSGTALTIEGPGRLEATGKGGGAGIGGNKEGDSVSDNGPSITINGGEIVAESQGTNTGAAIGAGARSPFGNITITGGNITAHAGSGGAGIGAGSDSGPVGNIRIEGDATITATSEAHGAGIGGGWGPSCGDIFIGGNAHIVKASSREHGTGIGAGCGGRAGKITITDNAVIDEANGGTSGAGIGASQSGYCGDIEISGNASVKNAQGGSGGAGIGAGRGSHVEGNITINTTGTVNATGGEGGVGIGSGSDYSSVEDIFILQGTVNAKGGKDSTGIGAGRNSTGGDIQIGDPDHPNNKVIVNAEGGMTNDGGNIQSFEDNAHTVPKDVHVFGDNTSVRAGKGEGLYNTSGVTDKDGNKLYSYPLYLYGGLEPEPDVSKGVAELPILTDADGNPILDSNNNPISIKSITAKGKDGSSITWSPDISHEQPNNFVYLWMTAQDQELTIERSDGKKVTLKLKFYENAGVWRTETQEEPEDAIPPEYSDTPTPPPKDPPEPEPPTPDPPASSDTPEPSVAPTPPSIPQGAGGIILQIGEHYGEILEVPRFYVSARALGLDEISIATQAKALEAIGVLRDAVNRVSDIRGDYGALQNRLQHNINNLSVAVENVSDAESRIRDADMAEEYTRMVKLNILHQSSQAMMAQANQMIQGTLQLLG